MNNQFDIRKMDKDAYNRVSDVHDQLEKEMQSEQPDNEKIVKLYMKEMNDAMFLGGVFTRNYGLYRPY